MATLDLADSEGIGHQVAGELGVDYHDCIGDSIYLWIEEVIETRRDLWLPRPGRQAPSGGGDGSAEHLGYQAEGGAKAVRCAGLGEAEGQSRSG